MTVGQHDHAITPPPLYLCIPQPITKTYRYTNHELLSGGNAGTIEILNSAQVPRVIVFLSTNFTLHQADMYGTRFGRSLAFLIEDTVSHLNKYWVPFGADPSKDETEDGLTEGIMQVLNGYGGFRGDELWVALGWEDEIYKGFWEGAKSGFEHAKAIKV